MDNLPKYNHRQGEADFDSIPLVSHEAHRSNFHSLQQMDVKITDVLEELKLKYGEGRITEDQICLKCGKFDSYSQGVYEGGQWSSAGLCRRQCFVKKKKN